MASPRTRDIKAGMAVLGLLIERPDSVAGITVRLEQDYPTAGWPRNIVHNTLPSLTKQGLISRTDGGSSPSWDWYEATTAGEAEFARWFEESAAAPPPMRDALLAKLKYVSRSEQLAVMVRDIAERESLTLREYDAALSRYRAAHSVGEITPQDSGDWRRRLRAGLLTFELLELQGRIKNLQRFREDLEDPAGRRDTLEEG